MKRFGFTIRTKHGQRVESIQIMAASLGDAERRLRQMYLQCQIIDYREQAVPRRLEALDMRRMMGLMPAPVPIPHKAGTQ